MQIMESHTHTACMFTCLTTFPIIGEVLIAVALYRAVPSPRLNLLTLVDEIMA